MFRRYLQTSISAALGLCCDEPGDGGGGGTPPASGTPGDQAPPADGGDPGADDLHAGDGGDDGDEAPDLSDEIDALPETNVRTQLRRQQRFNKRSRPLVERLRDPQTGRLMPAADLDRALADARQFQQLDQVFANSPKALQVFLDEQKRLGQSPAEAALAAADMDDDKPFNEDEWEFETDTAQGKRLLAMAKDLHESGRRVRRLEKGLKQTSSTQQEIADRGVEERFKSLALANVDRIPYDGPIKGQFVNAVYREFMDLKRTGRLTKANAEEIVEKTVLAFGGKQRPGPARTKTTIAQSAAAAGNKELPRTPRPGVVAPVNGQPKPKERETIADAAKSFFGRQGRGVPSIR